MRYLLDRILLLVSFSFHHFKYILPFLSGLQMFCSKISFSLMGIYLYVICCFSLAAFNICSLCLISISLINMCLGVFLLGFILYETLWASCFWVAFISHVAAAAAARLLQSSPTLCNPIDSSPSGSSVQGIL